MLNRSYVESQIFFVKNSVPLLRQGAQFLHRQLSPFFQWANHFASMKFIFSCSILFALFLSSTLCSAMKSGDVYQSEKILRPGLRTLFESCSKDKNSALFGLKDKLAYVACYDFVLAAPRWTAHILFSNRRSNGGREDVGRWTGTNSPYSQRFAMLGKSRIPECPSF
jgi:hypothetical protein